MNDIEEESLSPEHVGASRRRVIKEAAWSSPVIALATAAPQASASNSNGVIRFDRPQYEIAADGTTIITGVVVPDPGTPMPTTVSLQYPPGFTELATATVDAIIGAFSAPGVTFSDTVLPGQLVASAPGFTSGTTQLTTTTNVIPKPVDRRIRDPRVL